MEMRDQFEIDLYSEEGKPDLTWVELIESCSSVEATTISCHVEKMNDTFSDRDTAVR